MLDTHWDAIVVGTGIGGASAAYKLAQNNKRVLILEKGRAPSLKTGLPLWTSTITDVVKKKEFYPFLGEGLGGSSSLYGMVMERLEESDLIDQGGLWPLSIKDWIPYYEEAEQLFNVRPSSISDDFKPFLTELESRGVHPIPLSLSYLDKPGCEFCQGRLCEKECKVDAYSGPLKKISSNENVTILTGAEVMSVTTHGEKATGVKFIHEGQEKSHTADLIFLAAGALKTPYILRNSESPLFPKGLGNRFDLLGTRLMRHFVDLYFVEWETSMKVKDHKSISINDFYVDPRSKKKLGIFQSFGSLPPIEHVIADVTHRVPWVNHIPGSKRFLSSVIQNIFSKHAMASIIEDAPIVSNRLIFMSDRKVRLHYEISPEDHMKIEISRAVAAKIFGRFLKRVQHEAENNKRLGHACGTCAMGASPQESVTDYNGRIHDLENLFVVDASVFPSSTGKNPSLTIAANAIRITERSLGVHR